MSELILIRHGETTMAGTFCGHSNPPLNERGQHQAHALATSLTGLRFAAVYASDLLRARQTAEMLAVRGVEVLALSALREMNFGRWEGLRWSEIEATYATYATRWMQEFPTLPAPDGEAFADFEERVIACATSIVKTAAMPCAIVSHGGVMRVILERLFGYTRDQAWAETSAYASFVRCPTVRLRLPDGALAIRGEEELAPASDNATQLVSI